MVAAGAVPGIPASDGIRIRRNVSSDDVRHRPGSGFRSNADPGTGSFLLKDHVISVTVAVCNVPENVRKKIKPRGFRKT